MQSSRHSTTCSPLLRLLCVAVLVLNGCSLPVKPQRGGSASLAGLNSGYGATVSPGIAVNDSSPAVQRLEQPENPKDASTQNRNETEKTEILLPAGSTVQTREGTNVLSTITLSQATPMKRERTLSAAQNIGASQKDTAREIAAKIASMRPITLIVAGLAILMILGGIATRHPYFAVMFPSKSFSFLLIGGGVACLLAAFVLPMLIAGNETLLIICLAGFAFLILCAAAVYWFATHHEISKRAAYDQGWEDKNNDGIDDRAQGGAAGGANLQPPSSN